MKPSAKRNKHILPNSFCQFFRSFHIFISHTGSVVHHQMHAHNETILYMNYIFLSHYILLNEFWTTVYLNQSIDKSRDILLTKYYILSIKFSSFVNQIFVNSELYLQLYLHFELFLQLINYFYSWTVKLWTKF